VLRIFTALVVESRELERAVIAEMATSWFPEASSSYNFRRAPATQRSPGRKRSTGHKPDTAATSI
jgi:hypothetical protein